MNADKINALSSITRLTDALKVEIGSLMMMRDVSPEALEIAFNYAELIPIVTKRALDFKEFK